MLRSSRVMFLPKQMEKTHSSGADIPARQISHLSLSLSTLHVKLSYLPFQHDLQELLQQQ